MSTSSYSLRSLSSWESNEMDDTDGNLLQNSTTTIAEIGRRILQYRQTPGTNPSEESMLSPQIALQICIYSILIAMCWLSFASLLLRLRSNAVATSHSDDPNLTTQSSPIDIDERRKHLSASLVIKHVIRQPQNNDHDQSKDELDVEKQQQQQQQQQTGQKLLMFQQRRKSDVILLSDTETSGSTSSEFGNDDNNNTDDDGCSNFNKNHDIDNDDDEYYSHPFCTICLHNFHEGEEVCWSQNNECNHVFHHICIKEWLLRHHDCPCCRNNFLESPLDENKESAGQEQQEERNHDNTNDGNNTISQHANNEDEDSEEAALQRDDQSHSINSSLSLAIQHGTPDTQEHQDEYSHSRHDNNTTTISNDDGVTIEVELA